VALQALERMVEHRVRERVRRQARQREELLGKMARHRAAFERMRKDQHQRKKDEVASCHARGAEKRKSDRAEFDRLLAEERARRVAAEGEVARLKKMLFARAAAEPGTILLSSDAGTQTLGRRRPRPPPPQQPQSLINQP